MCIRVHVNIPICIAVYLCICISVYLYIGVHVYMYVCMHVYMYTCIDVYMYTSTYVYTYTCMYVYMCICVYAHMYGRFAANRSVFAVLCVCPRAKNRSTLNDFARAVRTCRARAKSFNFERFCWRANRSTLNDFAPRSPFSPFSFSVSSAFSCCSKLVKIPLEFCPAG